MDNSILAGSILDFNDNLQLVQQQRQSKFAMAFTDADYIGKQAQVVELIGMMEGEEGKGRAEPIVENYVDHTIRWVSPKDWDTGTTVDKRDLLRRNISPTGQYVKAGIQSANRYQDDVGIKAFFADAIVGENATNTVSFNSSNIVPVDEGAASDDGMNVDKLLAGREIFLGYDIDLDDPDNMMFCAISPTQERDMLDQIKVISKDYQDRAVLSNGGKTLDAFFGIHFIVTNRLLTDSNGYRRNPMWCKSGMHYGHWQRITGDIRELPDRKRKPLYVEVSQTLGATRVEEEKVVEIKCSEATE